MARTSTRAIASIAAVLVAASSLAIASAPGAAADSRIIIEGGGWGHGVGMGQWGAKGLADQGRSYVQILGHYYRGVSVANVGNPSRWNDVRVLLTGANGSLEIVPRQSTTVRYPGGTRSVGAHSVVRIGSNGSRVWVMVDGQHIDANGWPAPARPSVDLLGKRAVLRHAGGGNIGEYRWGRLEVSTGISGCPANQCAVVRGMTMQQYLYGLAEMPSSWHIEALKAQAVTGRAFADLKVGGSSGRLFDLRATVQDQVYSGWAKEGEANFGQRWVQAVDQTSGRVIQVGGTTVSGNYSASSGGHTEDSAYVWSTQHSHLRGVPDPTDNVSPRHRWSRSYTLAEIGAWFGVSNVRDVRITGSIGGSGRVDKATVQIIGSTTKQVTGNQFRATINARVPDSRALWSTKFRITNVSGFPDVPAGAYYSTAVGWLVQHGITDGVGDTGLYMPHELVTRAQMAAFMWRMMGRPTGHPDHGFPDVPRGSYYDQAVRFLRATGVTDGMGDTGLYAPHAPVTRAQMVAFLHRLSGLKAPTQRHPFPDVRANTYYDRAVSWAFQHGITDGVGDTGLYRPDDIVTRAQMAAFLHRLASRSSAWNDPLPPTAP